MSTISSFFSRFRRYGILGVSVLVVVVLVGILVWQQRHVTSKNTNNTNQAAAQTTTTNRNTSTRTTFERFQAGVNRNTAVPSTTLPTKEQTQQAIQQLQQQH